MKKSIFLTSLLINLISPFSPVFAENLEHTSQLFSTRQCENCDLSGAGFVLSNLRGVNLKQANLSGANLSRANLSGANLSGADLTGATLFGANLTGANLTGAIFSNTDLREANLTQANLTNTRLENAYIIGVIGLPNHVINSYEELYKLGLEEARAKNYRNAIEYYNRALSIRSDLAAVYFARSMAYGDLQDYNQALLDAKKAEILFTEYNMSQGQALAKRLQVEIMARKTPTQITPAQSTFSDLMGSLGSVLIKLLF